jgi:plastocyanin
MSARNLGMFSRPGRRATAASAVILGCALVGTSACSGGSAETPSTATSSTTSTTAPSDSASTPAATASAGSSAAAPASAVAGATKSPSAAAVPKPLTVLKISVQGRTVTPVPGRKSVSVGDRVKLIVTTDTANTLHVHGVEIEQATTPGVPLTVDFTVKDPGVYAVELHRPELLLLQLVVR